MTSSVVPSSTTAGGVLCRPAFVIGLGVLVLNDAWWKAEWPGVVTGKLSDIAGVIVAALLVTAIAVMAGADERRAALASSVIVGAAFGAMKTSAGGAAVAESAWTLVNGGPNRVVVDPTDLVALLALPIVPRRGTGIRGPDRSAVRRAARALAAAVLFAGGAAATTATSCAGGDHVVAIVARTDRLVAVDDLWRPIGSSSDGGTTWTDADPSEPTVGGADTSLADRDLEERPERRREVCIDEVCWRIERGKLARFVGDDRDGRIELQAVPNHRDECAGGGTGSVESIEQFPGVDGEPVLVAAMTGQGVAVSDGDGAWRRITVGHTSIPEGFGERWPPTWIWPWFSVVVSAAGVGIGTRAARRGRRGGREWVKAITYPLMGIAAFVSFFVSFGSGGLVGASTVLVGALLCGALVTVLAFISAWWSGPKVKSWSEVV